MTPAARSHGPPGRAGPNRTGRAWLSRAPEATPPAQRRRTGAAPPGAAARPAGDEAGTGTAGRLRRRPATTGPGRGEPRADRGPVAGRGSPTVGHRPQATRRHRSAVGRGSPVTRGRSPAVGRRHPGRQTRRASGPPGLGLGGRLGPVRPRPRAGRGGVPGSPASASAAGWAPWRRSRGPDGACVRQAKTTVREPFSRTRCSLCHFTARASAWHSTSRPTATSWSGVTSWPTRSTSCSMIGPSSRSAVT